MESRNSRAAFTMIQYDPDIASREQPGYNEPEPGNARQAPRDGACHIDYGETLSTIVRLSLGVT